MSSLESLARLLEELSVTHVVTIPDNTSAELLEQLRSCRTVFATREGEAIALAAGLWLGGARPVALIQNTGLLESGDALRGTASRMGAPLLLLVTCRGYGKARSRGLEPGGSAPDRDVLVTAGVDSVALMTEETLRAWGVPHEFLRDTVDLSAVRRAWNRAGEEERPVAVLLDLQVSS